MRSQPKRHSAWSTACGPASAATGPHHFCMRNWLGKGGGVCQEQRHEHRCVGGSRLCAGQSCGLTGVEQAATPQILAGLPVPAALKTRPGGADVHNLAEHPGGDDLLHLVEERLQPVLLEGEERLAGLPLCLKNAVDVGDLRDGRWGLSAAIGAGHKPLRGAGALQRLPSWQAASPKARGTPS